VEAGDDNGVDATGTSVEAGDDNGVDATSNMLEAGDDNGVDVAVTSAEVADDNGVDTTASSVEDNKASHGADDNVATTQPSIPGTAPVTTVDDKGGHGGHGSDD